MPTKITAITNQKGGEGKTTVSAALLSCLHQRGARVLGVDLDPQGSLGFSLGLDIEHCATVYDIFRGAAQPEEVIRQTDTCDILPSNILLSAAELEFNKPGREFPMAPEVLSLLGVSQIKETIESVRNYYNSRLQVLGILLNRFNARLNLSREMLELAQQIAAQLQTKVFQAKIRSSVSAAEAPAHGVSIMDYAPRSKPAMDFEALCQEILGESSAEEVR